MFVVEAYEVDWISPLPKTYTILDVRSRTVVWFLIHRGGFADPKGLESLTASPQAFSVSGQLTATVELSLDLALVFESILHLIISLRGI